MPALPGHLSSQHRLASQMAQWERTRGRRDAGAPRLERSQGDGCMLVTYAPRTRVARMRTFQGLLTVAAPRRDTAIGVDHAPTRVPAQPAAPADSAQIAIGSPSQVETHAILPGSTVTTLTQATPAQEV